MMKRLFIIVLSTFLSGFALSAQEVVSVTDSVAVSDTVELSDEEIMKMLSSPQADTVKKVVDRGYDVGRFVNARRQRSVDFTPFTNKPFLANTFVSAGLKTAKLINEDYSFGLLGTVSFGKWLHEDHGVRLDFGMGGWTDNLDSSPIRVMDLNASYLFNLTSYVGGYRTNRFGEVLIVAGAGYANSFYGGKFSHALSGHVGFNLKLRIFDDIDFFVEPLARIYSNGMAVSYAGNWRSFQATCGLSYNIRQSESPASKALLPQSDGWFISLAGGVHFQNSRLVYETVGLVKSLGVHMNLGLGKYYTDWFAMRYSGAFSRGSWVIYEGEGEFPCNYFAARAEGMIDFVGLIGGSSRERKSPFSASLLIGPEIGYMYKVDHESDAKGHIPVISSAYIGVTGGLQLKAYLTDRFALFLEPRFTVLPYDAPSHDYSVSNQFRNYYDGVFNANFGIEFML